MTYPIIFLRCEDSLTEERINNLIQMIKDLDKSIEEHYSKFHIKFRKNADFCLIYAQKINLGLI
jgi:predicted transport protein